MISPVSGAIFERRLIEKFLLENGVDPINGKPLAVEQLIDVKSELIYFIFLSKRASSFLFSLLENRADRQAWAGNLFGIKPLIHLRRN